MYAAHFAAGLAIRSRAPKAPAWALLTAVFLPDFVWIGLSGTGIEPATGTLFFDDWSHSALSILVEASLFALLFYRRGISVWLPIWLAGLSHLVLDLPIHPRPIALYPYAALHAPWDLWHWDETKSFLGASHYWWVQLAIVIALLGVYLANERKREIPRHLAFASAITVVGLHLLY